MEERKPSISFFCPAYYDEKNLSNVIAHVYETLIECAYRFEIIVIEDGSPDRTGAIADELRDRYPNVSVVHHPRNLGYGASVRRGFECASQYDYVCYTDGDNQYDFGEISKMLPLLKNYDAVISYRKVKEYGLVRKLLSAGYNYLIQKLFRVPFTDVNSSLKLFKRSVINAITIESVSPFVAAETVIKAYNRGFKITEIGIFSYPRIHGKSSSITISTVTGSLYDLTRLWITERARLNRVLTSD